MANERSRVRWTRWSLLIIAAAVTLLVPTTPAAAATGSGGGAGSWQFNGAGVQMFPPCAKLTQITYQSTVYEGTYAIGTQTYVGGLNVQVTAGDGTTTLGYANPTGTYRDSSCTTPDSIPVSSEVRGNNPVLGTNVACNFDGEFQRVGTHAITTLQGTCTVNGETERPNATTEVRNSELACITLGPPPLTCTSVDTYAAV